MGGFSLNWLNRILAKTGPSRPSKGQGQGPVMKRAPRGLTNVWTRSLLQNVMFWVWVRGVGDVGPSCILQNNASKGVDC